MAPSHGHRREANSRHSSNSDNDTHSDSARMEQIITEFFHNSLHMILQSRSPSVSSSPNKYDFAYDNQAYSSSGGDLQLPPTVVDVLLVAGEDFGPRPRWSESEKIVERWVIQYECPKNNTTSKSTTSSLNSTTTSTSRRSSSSVVLQALYKKSILLLRSLYVTVRLLPAYKLFRGLSSSGRIPTFNLTPLVLPFVEPFTRAQESQMQRFCFTPVDTPRGRLCLSVMYRPLLSDMTMMTSPAQESATPVTPKFIPDYVGSPLAHPIKRIPSLPARLIYDDGSLAPHSHSWGRPYKPISHPPRPSKTSTAFKNNSSLDDLSPSPSMSPSPYLSSPVSIPGNHPAKVPCRAESAPDRMPAPTRIGNFPESGNKQILVPSSSLRSSRLSISRLGKYMGLCQTDAAVEKDDFDEFENDCPFFMDDDDMTDSSSSRSESFDRKAHLLEQIESRGLFPVKKSQHAAIGALVHMLKKAPPLSSSSINLLQASMLETWSSKRIHEPNQISGYVIAQPTSPWGLMPSGPVMSKTTTDALEELRGYKVMKDVLLSRSSRT